MPLVNSQCHICHSREIILFNDFSKLYRVTSDCKPWKQGGTLSLCNHCHTLQKPVNSMFEAEIDEIYNNYSIYYQSNGKEQNIFDQQQGISQSRSEYILKHLLQNNTISKQGNLLDVGCGNGTFLSAFYQHFPLWSLSGFEPNESTKKSIEMISPQTRFYSGSLDVINEKFDIITMIHSLEHIPDPAQVLSKLKNMLNSNGILLIVVPNYLKNPFDLIIADHCSHFSINSLSRLLGNCGFSFLTNNVQAQDKELLIIAKHFSNQSSITLQNDLSGDEIKQQVQWLQTVEKNFLSLGNTNLGVFGTSIAANWLLAINPHIIDFFVDEDTNRIGKFLNDKIILKPKDIPVDANIFLPFPTDIAKLIYQRLKQYPGTYHFPVN